MKLVNIENGKITTELCYICERKFNSTQGRFPVSESQPHHHPPREYRKRKNYVEKKVYMCEGCHKQIHRMFTNKELKNMTIEELKNHSTIKKWIKWICRDRKKSKIQPLYYKYIKTEENIQRLIGEIQNEKSNSTT